MECVRKLVENHRYQEQTYTRERECTSALRTPPKTEFCLAFGVNQLQD